MSNNPDDKKPSENSPEAKSRHRYRMEHDWQNLIDDLIEEGREQGVFDNLPGKGKPLNLKRNLFAPEKELAYDLLKQNDLKPAWIMARSDLMTQIDSLRADIKRKWTLYEREYRLRQGEGQCSALIIAWDDICLKWAETITELNRQINNFNLKRPSDNLELFKLALDSELERAGARRYLRQL
ncbi:MAG: DUF1992 domain-containing protein [Ardenticatenaceae bacterium]|nr:DUF1992 domain-containing protein [Ardenticatenaceae bacterium]MCB9445812.1 DUF1992 domain-containing protein [Ardenticatenaceae bacterium]